MQLIGIRVCLNILSRPPTRWTVLVDSEQLPEDGCLVSSIRSCFSIAQSPLLVFCI